ncbi:MAG: elongation factor EF-2 [Candidatus Lokiarchaeota archaeon]|nr:elongation factor EF-2 [Candidatus Lokiarchaeota archaeon]MBD3201890.1 elongation factor EF-2 [Candidatus Lokiarchaeota archaeon]
MPRRKDISEILELMKKTERIRNIGFVGHIDHGKTTLSDSLLSEAGLLNPELAGEARVLDYLEEEQQRGITMKSTNISLYYESPTEKNNPFLVNLVDTPGHLDFSGKVTRALRLIDGVVVVVDAVEEIISQSETVIRQAIEEGVKPVLYINKVDRLIRELKLNNEEIRKKYSRIINDFNKLIERYADPPFDKNWQVSPKDGNVAFGSALHKWGFTLSLLHESSLKFKDIRSRYKKETYSKDTYADLSVYLPIHRAILEMVVNFLPNPSKAQKYRIKKIWNGDLSSQIGKSMETCDPDGPLAICVSKVQADKYGLVATGRIFSGTCSKREEIFIIKENNFESIQRLAIFMGQRREQVEKIPVGNIVALEGIKGIKSGETIVEKDFIDTMVPFGNVKYVTTPVVTVSIEPEYLRDLDEMKKIIENLLVEDPNLKFDINEDTGEFLLSGMGPLHLEVTANEIKKRGVKVSTSEPHAVYKESCRYNSSLIHSSNPSNENFVEVSIERLDDKTASFFQKSDHQSIKQISKLKETLHQETSLEDHEIEHFWNCDDDQNLLIYEGEKEIDDYLKSLIIEIIDKIHLNGPLCGEKLTEIKFIIKNLKFSNFDEETAFTDLSVIFYDAIKRALKEAEPVLLEPIYNTIIQLPPEYVKKAVSLLSKFSARIKFIDQENEYQAKLEIFLAVRHSIKFAEDLRSITSGKAFWQNEFHSFMEVPEQEANRIINDLKFAKGLAW